MKKIIALCLAMLLVVSNVAVIAWAQDTITFAPVKSIKIGDTLRGKFQYQGATAGMEPCLAIPEEYGSKFYIVGGGGLFPDVPESGPVQVVYHQGKGGFAINAINIGTVQVKCYSSTSAAHAKEEPVAIYPVTIMTPTITTNVKGSYVAGDEITFSTTLEGISDSFPEGDITKLTEEYRSANIHDSDDVPFTYRAKTEIIEGSDLVAQSNVDYSQALRSTESLKFTGTGIVKIKVSYVPVYYYEEHEIDDSGKDFVAATYSPSKTITIQVTPNVENAVSDATGTKVNANMSGLALENIYKANGIDPDASDTEVVLSEGKVREADKEKLAVQAEKNGYTVTDVYEILMHVFVNGNKAAEVKENFGTITLTLQTDAKYAGQKAVVYQLHNGNEVIVHDGLTVGTDGKVSINVNKLSTFAIAVEPQDNQNAVPTGDEMNVLPWVVLMGASVIFAASMFIVGKRRKQRGK